jgi:hypothetical protein
MQHSSEDERLAFTRTVMELLEDWGLQAADMVVILDLPDDIQVGSLGRYRGGEIPFPDDPRVMHRVHYLLRIADALHTTYPTSPDMRKRWMRQANRHFGAQSPVACMLNGGESGLMTVLAQLDCTYAWDLTGSKATY